MGGRGGLGTGHIFGWGAKPIIAYGCAPCAPYCCAGWAGGSTWGFMPVMGSTPLSGVAWSISRVFSMATILERLGIALTPVLMTLGRSCAPNPGMEGGVTGTGRSIPETVVVMGEVSGAVGLTVPG